MTNAPELAVTGSTGQLGALVARLLAQAGSQQRLLVRDAARAPELEGAVPFVTTYAEPERRRRRLPGRRRCSWSPQPRPRTGCSSTTPSSMPRPQPGVQHIVYTSFFGAAPDSTFTLGRDHFATEERIKASGMDYTFLRDNFYLDFLPLLAGEDGVIRGPAGDGVMAAVARSDIARSAVTVLRDPSLHVGRTYDLTGPEDISLARAAELLTAGTGRTITFHNETLAEAYASRASYGAPPWQVDAWVSTYTAIAAGELAGPTSAVHELTGREPLSLAQFLAEAHTL